MMLEQCQWRNYSSRFGMCLDGLIQVTEIFGKDSQCPGGRIEASNAPIKVRSPADWANLLEEKEISKLGGFTIMSFLFHSLDWWSRLGSVCKALLMWLQFFWGIGRAAGIWRRRERERERERERDVRGAECRTERSRQMQAVLVYRLEMPESMWWTLNCQYQHMHNFVTG